MNSCHVTVDRDKSYLRKSSRENIETMLWGAVCMPDSRDRILGMSGKIFSKGFRELLCGFEKSLEEKKVDVDVVGWFLENQVSIANSTDVLESLKQALHLDAEREAMKRVAGELAFAAKIGNRDTLVKIMKECLATLGEQ
jgi:hypothetical protein